MGEQSLQNMGEFCQTHIRWDISPAALHEITRCAHMDVQLQGLPQHSHWTRGNTVHDAHEPILLKMSSLRPWKVVSLNILKKNGMADCCAADLPASTGQAVLGWISELTSLYLWEVKENTAVVTISPLTLFLICLQAMICFTDVARAPPPPLLWPNV